MIGEIAVFMICAQAVIHFRPKEAYGKYLRLLLSVIVLVQILSPVYELFWGLEGTRLTDNIRTFQQEMEKNMEEAAERSADVDVQLEEMNLGILWESWSLNSQEEAGVESEDPEQNAAGSTDEAVAEGAAGAEVAETEETIRPEVEAVEIKIVPVEVQNDRSGGGI